MKTMAQQGRRASVTATGAGVEHDPHGFTGVAENLFPQLHALNFEFLKLLTVNSFHPVEGDLRLGLPPTVIGPLRGLSDRELMRMAECPSALFDLSFDDAVRWERSCCMDTSVFEEPRGQRTYLRSDRFVASVIFLIWHSVKLNPTFARFAFGLRESTAEQLNRLAVTHVVRIAPSAVEWLHARWADNAHFWPNLIRSAVANSPIQLQVAKLMGCQLMAAMDRVPREVVHVRHVSVTRK